MRTAPRVTYVEVAAAGVPLQDGACRHLGDSVLELSASRLDPVRLPGLGLDPSVSAGDLAMDEPDVAKEIRIDRKWLGAPRGPSIRNPTVWLFSGILALSLASNAGFLLGVFRL